MGRSASVGRVSIDLDAGTAKFLIDMNKANAVVTDFGNRARGAAAPLRQLGEAGQHSASQLQGASAAIRVLEGGITNNLRAAERFTANVLGLGPILQAAFPVVGAIAFAGILVKVGEEFTKFVKTIQTAPEKLSGSFRELNSGARQTNDELELTNVKLQNQINKIEGKRQNVLKEAIFEARVEADKLGEALDKDIKKLFTILEEQDPTSHLEHFNDWLHDLPDEVKKAMKDIGGYGGMGGMNKEIAVATLTGNKEMTAAAQMPTKTPEQARAAALAQEAAQLKLNLALNTAYEKEITNIKNVVNTLTAAQEKQWQAEAKFKAQMALPMDPYKRTPTPPQSVDFGPKLEMWNNILTQMQLKQSFIASTSTHAALQGTLKGVEEDRTEAGKEKAFKNKIAEIEAAIAAAKKHMEGIGLGELAQSIADGKAKALEAIADIEKAQRRLDPKAPDLSAPKAKQVTDLEVTLAEREAYNKWATKLAEVTAKIKDQTASQKLLTDAIGKGYAAVKSAAVETSVMKEVGAERYQDFLKNGANAADILAVRAAQGAAYEEEHRHQMAETGQTLKEQTDLSVRLSQVQYLGEQAVRLATLQHTLELMKQKGASQELLDAETLRFAAERSNEIAKSIADINDKIEAIDRLAAAELNGAKAVRQANLENKVADIRRQGDEPIPGIIGVGQKEFAARTEDAKEYNLEIAKSAGERINEFSNSIEKLNQEKALLEAVLAAHKGDLDTMRALRDVEDQRLKVMVQQELQQRTAIAGVRAFFFEMEQQAKSSSNIMLESLNSALDKFSENFTKLITGQKTEWKKMFQEIGRDMLKQSVKSGLQTALGKVGDAIPSVKKEKDRLKKQAEADKAWGKTAAQAWWVRLAGKDISDKDSVGGGAAGSPGGKTPPIFGNGGILGTGSVPTADQTPQDQDSDSSGPNKSLLKGIGGVLGFLTRLIPRAGGGPGTPGTNYLVGENGPEIFRTSQAGQFISNADSRRQGGGSGGNVYVDARWSRDPYATRAQVEAAMHVSHSTAVTDSIRSQKEAVRRRPQRGG